MTNKIHKYRFDSIGGQFYIISNSPRRAVGVAMSVVTPTSIASKSCPITARQKKVKGIQTQNW
jgi:hypothetical protein